MKQCTPDKSKRRPGVKKPSPVKKDGNMSRPNKVYRPQGR